MNIPANTRIGAVRLRVRDVKLCSGFYRNALGLHAISEQDLFVRLGVGGEVLVELEEDADAERAANRPGLFHLALLLPSSRALASWLQHVQRAGWPLQGASDHGVSKAIYLSDPEGNGIEVYCDRDRGRWPFVDGQLRMGTERLDMQKLLDLAEGEWAGMSDDTRMGHVHLRVNDIAASEYFYCALLGFDLMQRYGDEARFVSAGGYHHHLGLNVWHSRGAAPAPEKAAGLVHYQILLPATSSLTVLRARLEEAAIAVHEDEHALSVRDPAGNGIVVRVE